MAVLVTGAGGFIGTSVVNVLLESGTSVVATDRDLSALAPHDALSLKPGDITDSEFQASLFESSVDGVVHLATIPGGAAEQESKLALQVNVNATLDLIQLAGQHKKNCRFVYASAIAVYGDAIPPEGVDDATPLQPKLHYAMHKMMCEIAVGTFTRRGEVDGVAIRFPGIVARPAGAAGFKSAFINDIFHVMRSGEGMTLPVSEAAQLWLMSRHQVAQNVLHALNMDSSLMPEDRVVTLPAVYAKMSGLVSALSSVTGTPADKVSYDCDDALEAAFGAWPPLTTANADKAGFTDDGSLEQLVENTFKDIE